MKLGLGLYRHMLTEENFRFARQAGATHIVAHLVDYFRDGAHVSTDNQPTGDDRGWGRAGDPDRIWSLEELRMLKQAVNAAGLELAAIENFDPAHWHDVLLDGPQKAGQLENLKEIIRRLGATGIPVMGYNFSLTGVCGRIVGPYARGQALSVGMEGTFDKPMPKGMVWNMIYDPQAPPEPQPPVTHEELWRRLEEFLHAVLPVAEEVGVRLAAHAEDPPLPTMRGQPRLIYQPYMYRRLLAIYPGPANAIELCVGTLAEMTEGDVYEAVDEYSRRGAVAYVHLRNVRGKVPRYRETFIDEGDVDILRVLRILKRNGFDGVIIPDHTPQMSCAAPWHAGMAHALGYIRGLLETLEREDNQCSKSLFP